MTHPDILNATQAIHAAQAQRVPSVHRDGVGV